MPASIGVGAVVIISFYQGLLGYYAIAINIVRKRFYEFKTRIQNHLPEWCSSF